MRLNIIMTSTRDGRKGMPIAEWIVAFAKNHAKFDVEFVDLREVALPIFDEPQHPVKQQYAHEHTKKWSAIVKPADAFVFVMPEYNHNVPPAFLNAVDYLSVEWNYKAAAFVTYGGVSGGTRSSEAAMGLCTMVKMMPIPDGVAIPLFEKSVSGGKYDGATQEKAASHMLDELYKWTTALKPLRA